MEVDTTEMQHEKIEFLVICSRGIDFLISINMKANFERNKAQTQTLDRRRY